MKLKLNKDGSAVVKDGKPVYVHANGREEAFDAPAAWKLALGSLGWRWNHPATEGIMAKSSGSGTSKGGASSGGSKGGSGGGRGPGPGNAGGWPSTTGQVSGGNRSNAPPAPSK